MYACYEGYGIRCPWKGKGSRGRATLRSEFFIFLVVVAMPTRTVNITAAAITVALTTLAPSPQCKGMREAATVVRRKVVVVAGETMKKTMEWWKNLSV